MSLRSLDLFSGVGGLTLALKGIAEPLLYCDVSKESHTVITNAIAAGRLPAAPIVDCVTKVNADLLADRQVDMVVAGFPCVGFSPMGKRQGFENQQSGLFYELVRVIGVARPKLVFMENVPEVISKGTQTIAQELDQRGYDYWWCVMPAFAVGSPQYRRRWFALAVRRDITDLTVHAGPYRRHDWSAEAEPQRMVPVADKRRFTLCGNAVVPDCARKALLFLLGGCRKLADDLSPGDVRVTYPPAGRPMRWGRHSLCGACVGGVCHALPPPRLVKPDLGIVLDPALYRGTPKNRLSSPILTEPVRLALWATPRYGCPAVCAILTLRAKNDLCSQLRWATTTPDEDRGKQANPEWVEWLMGLPAGHTALMTT